MFCLIPGKRAVKKMGDEEGGALIPPGFPLFRTPCSRSSTGCSTGSSATGSCRR